MEPNKHRSNADLMTAWQTPAGQLPLDVAAEVAGQTLGDAAALERTEDAWWAWHDADQSRIYASTDEAQAVCVAWVAGQSDVGPDLTAHRVGVTAVERDRDGSGRGVVDPRVARRWPWCRGTGTRS